jgi:hypothetical protein
VQLQQHLPEFNAAGISVFAISYDRVEAQAAFAEEFGITFPLLADPDHRVIEATGILNTLVKPEEEGIYGVPYPGTYVIGPDGAVEEKLFYQHYRTRPSASTVLREGFGLDFEVENHPSADVESEGVRITATLGGESMVFMETSTLYVDIGLDEGLHLYGQPIPDGYIATEVEVAAPEGIVVEQPQYPPTAPFHVEGIDDEFQAFEGDIRIRVPVHMRLTDAESFTLDVTVRYQACNDRECYLPQTQQLSVEVPINPLNRPQRRD